MKKQAKSTVRFSNKTIDQNRKLPTRWQAISLESADISKTLEFVTENIERINSEIEKFDAERDEIIANASLAKRRYK